MAGNRTGSGDITENTNSRAKAETLAYEEDDALVELPHVCGCDVDDILLEMGHILHPEGTMILKDDIDTLVKIQNTIDGMRWKSWLAYHESGPFAREKLLIAINECWIGTKKATKRSL